LPTSPSILDEFHFAQFYRSQLEATWSDVKSALSRYSKALEVSTAELPGSTRRTTDSIAPRVKSHVSEFCTKVKGKHERDLQQYGNEGETQYVVNACVQYNAVEETLSLGIISNTWKATFEEEVEESTVIPLPISEASGPGEVNGDDNAEHVSTSWAVVLRDE
jgi:hypothetical protein